MQAVAIDKFGGTDKLKARELPTPQAGPGEVLVQVDTAGVGVWDPFEVEGGFAKMFNAKPAFPYVPGSDCAGVVAAVGEGVTKVKEGDKVYAFCLMNPKGGCYAEYCAVQQDMVSRVPGSLTLEEAGAMPICAVTALRGLDDTLKLQKGENLLILGASGGIGHLAVQLAKRMGARVLAVASGEEGVALCRKLGADMAIDGHKDDIYAAAKNFAPDGLDAALLTTGGEPANAALRTLRKGGRAAHPNGVEQEPAAPGGVELRTYDGTPDAKVIERLDSLIEQGPFEVHVAKTFPLEQAAEAHRALDTHFMGKMILRPGA
jgi:NADPH:quinone reductase-like Zn-dependent oxidoreductase